MNRTGVAAIVAAGLLVTVPGSGPASASTPAPRTSMGAAAVPVGSGAAPAARKARRASVNIAGWRFGKALVRPGRTVRDRIRVLPAGRHTVFLQASGGRDWRTIRKLRTRKNGWLSLHLRAPRTGSALYRVKVPPSRRHVRDITRARRVTARRPRPPAPAPLPLTHVLAPEGRTVTTYITGDIGHCPPKGQPGWTAAMMLARPLATVLPLGDISNEKGSARDYATCYHPFWGAFRNRTWPVPGNHDYNSGAQPYFAYFGPRVGVLGRSWYVLRMGSWHFLMLDSNCPRAAVGGCHPASRQYRSIARYLATYRPKCLAAATHHPRYSSGNRPFAHLGPLWQLLTRYGAEALFSAHTHNYQRFTHMGSNGRPGRGPRQFISATGGARLVPVKRPLVPGLRYRIAKHFGLMEVTLRPDGYSWAYLPTSGGRLDAGSDSC